MKDFSDRARFYGIETNEKYEEPLVRSLNTDSLLSEQAELIGRLKLQVNSLSEKLGPYTREEEADVNVPSESEKPDYNVSISPVSNRIATCNGELLKLLRVLVSLEERVN